MTRGGRRPGAGRPALGRLPIHITLPPDLYRWLEGMNDRRGWGKNMSLRIERILRCRFNAEAKRKEQGHEQKTI